jgi:hypothetical protein
MGEKAGIIGAVMDENLFVEATEIGGTHYWWSKWQPGIGERTAFRHTP